MSSIVRTIHTTHPLLKISKMVAVLLLIFFPVLASANPVYQSSSSRYAAPSTVGAQSMQYLPASYQMTNTSNYQMSTTLNPAQTVYAPFSDETPSNSGPSKMNGRRNSTVVPTTPPDPGEEPDEYPLGDAWSLLIFAVLGAGVIYIKQRKKIEAKG